MTERTTILVSHIFCNEKLKSFQTGLSGPILMTTDLDPLTFDPGYLDAMATEANAAGPRLVAPCSLSLNVKKNKDSVPQGWNCKVSIALNLPHAPSSLTHWPSLLVDCMSLQYSVGYHKPHPVAIYGHSQPTPNPWEWEACLYHHHILQPAKKQTEDVRALISKDLHIKKSNKLKEVKGHYFVFGLILSSNYKWISSCQVVTMISPTSLLNVTSATRLWGDCSSRDDSALWRASWTPCGE